MQFWLITGEPATPQLAEAHMHLGQPSGPAYPRQSPSLLAVAEPVHACEPVAAWPCKTVATCAGAAVPAAGRGQPEV